MFFVCILQNTSTGRFYIGHCDNLIRRFNEHRDGQNKSTRNRGSWWMPCYETYPARSEAMKREMQLKRMKSSLSIRA
ncbi:MAG: GIY-YIG nuclease family protein [Kiritimatiellia bacterium]